MKHLIISLVVIWAFFQISSLIWSSKGQSPSPTFTQLLKPPQYRLTNPYENAYYYLPAFAADPSLDPAKVGNKKCLKTPVPPGTTKFTSATPGRRDLRIQPPMNRSFLPGTRKIQ